jgi:hypothetical protein
LKKFGGGKKTHSVFDADSSPLALTLPTCISSWNSARCSSIMGAALVRISLSLNAKAPLSTK